MKSIIKDAMILFLITAVAGVLLAVVNEVTKEPIRKQKEAQVEAACGAVFPEAASFTQEPDPQQQPDYADWQSKYPKDIIDQVYLALAEDGSSLGVVINVTNKEGYGGSIRFSMGVGADGTLKGVSVLETSETPGLGLQAEEVLLPQFSDRKADSFRYVRGGGASASDEVDAISSATITTNAFVNGINAGLDYYRLVYGGLSGTEDSAAQ